MNEGPLDRLTQKLIDNVTTTFNVTPRLLDAVREILPADAVSQLLGGQFLIPTATLEPELRAVIRPHADLTRCTGRDDGIHLELELARWHQRIRMELAMTLVVEELAIGHQDQRALVRLERPTLRGRNFGGSIAAALFRWRLRSPARLLTAIAVEPIEEAPTIQIQPQPPDRVEIDLADHPLIRKLKSLQIGSHSLLQHLQVVGCRHDSRGLRLQGHLNLS